MVNKGRNGKKGLILAISNISALTCPNRKEFADLQFPYIYRTKYFNIRARAQVMCVAVLPDGRVVSGSSDKSLKVWQAA